MAVVALPGQVAAVVSLADVWLVAVCVGPVVGQRVAQCPAAEAGSLGAERLVVAASLVSRQVALGLAVEEPVAAVLAVLA
jgi:hypothetical protein